ncbi:Metallo-dependent phosphatase-like [Trinorchestia longiramus]|nr:Metallo-dependent phosphatase-like [Trinorchestia longiramus]
MRVTYPDFYDVFLVTNPAHEPSVWPSLMVSLILSGIDYCSLSAPHGRYCRYESTITAQFYGHTHYDELEVFYDDDDVTRPISIAYVGPSVTTYPDLNPGYRVYLVEKGAGEGVHRVVDHETWIMDLDVANSPRNAGSDPHWYRLYSARQAYEMRSLLPVDWDNLVYRMVEDQELFDTFYRNYWKNSPKREACDAECKKRLLCDLKSGRSNDRKQTCAVVHERVEAQERSQWRSWLYSGLTLTYVWVRRKLGFA